MEKLTAGQEISFTYPVTGGTYSARVIANHGPSMTVAINGFPQGPEGLRVGDVATIDPQWVNAPTTYAAVYYKNGYVRLRE
jgi:hypothetical protein